MEPFVLQTFWGLSTAELLQGLDSSGEGLSQDEAADVAKESADIVLLEKEPGVLAEGVDGGRITFANTLKYVFMATSDNFSNMFTDYRGAHVRS